MNIVEKWLGKELEKMIVDYCKGLDIHEEN